MSFHLTLGLQGDDEDTYSPADLDYGDEARHNSSPLRDKVETQAGIKALNDSHPDDPAFAYPKVGFTTALQPYRGVQGWPCFRVDLACPSRLHLQRQQELDGLTASARATESYAPILDAILDEHKVPKRHLCRKHIPLNHLQPSHRKQVIDPAKETSFDCT